MKTYNQLVRLHEHRLHERQKAVADLEAEAGEMRTKVEELEAQMAMEDVRAQEGELGAATFVSYFRRASEKRRALSDALNAVARNILTARLELKRAFDELKRTETLRDKMSAEIEDAARRAEQAELDEVALQQHRRGSAG